MPICKLLKHRKLDTCSNMSSKIYNWKKKKLHTTDNSSNGSKTPYYNTYKYKIFKDMSKNTKHKNN